MPSGDSDSNRGHAAEASEEFTPALFASGNPCVMEYDGQLYKWSGVEKRMVRAEQHELVGKCFELAPRSVTVLTDF